MWNVEMRNQSSSPLRCRMRGTSWVHGMRDLVKTHPQIPIGWYMVDTYPWIVSPDLIWQGLPNFLLIHWRNPDTNKGVHTVEQDDAIILCFFEHPPVDIVKRVQWNSFTLRNESFPAHDVEEGNWRVVYPKSSQYGSPMVPLSHFHGKSWL